MRVVNLARVCRQFSSTLINFELVQILLRVVENSRYGRGNIQSTLTTLVVVLPGHES